MTSLSPVESRQAFQNVTDPLCGWPDRSEVVNRDETRLVCFSPGSPLAGIHRRGFMHSYNWPDGSQFYFGDTKILRYPLPRVIPRLFLTEAEASRGAFDFSIPSRRDEPDFLLRCRLWSMMSSFRTAGRRILARSLQFSVNRTKRHRCYGIFRVSSWSCRVISP